MHLQSLLNQVSQRIMTWRKSVTGEHFLCLKIVKMVNNQTLDKRKKYSYQMQLSFLNEHSARCDSQIGHSLSLNKRIMQCLAECHGNMEVFSSQPVVNLQEQNNAFFLFSAKRNSEYFDLSLSQNYDIIKQRSITWLTLWKTAKVTGRTLYNALGLSSLSDLKQHHCQFIKKRSPPPFSDDENKRLEYGTENEKHIIATVLGNLVPALLPHCFAFQEVGSVFLDIAGEENFIEVSADSLLMCFGGDACPEKKTAQNHFAIPLEGKCLFPDSSKPIEPMYQIYPCYVPQTLSEMAAYNAKLLWLLSFAVSSVVLLNIRFDKKLWEMMCRICMDLHGGQEPKVPVKLHLETKALKSHITKFISTHCSFVCEIPSYFGLETALRESSIISPYSFFQLKGKTNYKQGDHQKRVQNNMHQK